MTLCTARHLRSFDGVVLDARPTFGPHLEGAIHADLATHLSTASDPDFDPSIGGRHPLPPVERWARLVGEWGIAPETHVVVYDEADGSNAAARTWWMLRAIGHRHVCVLDGGLRAAIEEGLPLMTETCSPQSTKPYPATEWLLPVVSIEDVDELRNDPRWRVLDVRSAPRFRGETEPIDPVAGHIPGAVNLPFADNLDDGRFKPADELRAQYERLLDGRSPDELIVHCGSGVTACHTLLALDVAGLEGAALFVGSWSEWCRTGRPIATTEP